MSMRTAARRRGCGRLVLVAVLTYLQAGAAGSAEECAESAASGAHAGEDEQTGASAAARQGPGDAVPSKEPPGARACKDINDNCAKWAQIGECDKNPGYMTIECAHSCATCHLRDPKLRCKPFFDAQRSAPFDDGELDAAMQRAASFSEFSPTVLSSDPWVIRFDSFLSAEEVAAVRAVYQSRTLERSSNVGAMNELGRYEKKLDSSRTSENAWCQDSCARVEAIRHVSHRIGNVTGADEAHSEFLQLLRYEPGQYYRQHHDFIPSHMEFPFGPRLLTMFVYLSDVDEGGGTKFNKLNITVMPRVGRAVLWPSVRNDRLDSPDYRTMHEAMPVLAGTKYAANAWLHRYDFRTPHGAGCAP